LRIADHHDIHVGRRRLDGCPLPDHANPGPVEARPQPEAERAGRRRHEDADHARGPSQRRTTSLGIAAARAPPITIALSPTTSPRALSSGPPELPGARWTSERMYVPRSGRPGTATAASPLTTPTVTTQG